MTERSRTALRPIDPPAGTPFTGGHEEHAGPSRLESNKRARSLFQTPAALHLPAHAAPMDTPMLLSDRSQAPAGYSGGGEILEYLRGRGGRIKELEDELARARQRQDNLSSELQLKQEQIALLQAEVAAARAASLSRMQAAGRAELASLEKLLDQELRKGVEVEARLREVSERLHEVEERAASERADARRDTADAARRVQATQIQVEAAQRQIQAVQAECEDKVKRAQREAKIERSKREADQEVHRAVLRQLEELRATAAPPCNAAPNGSAVAQQVQQLQEALRTKEAELLRANEAAEAASRLAAAATAAAAAAAGTDHAAVTASASPSGRDMATLRGELEALQARLRAWEQGPLQQALAATAGSGPDPTRTGSSVEEAAAAVRRLAQHSSEMRALLAARDAALAEAAARAAGAEQQARAADAALAARDAELQTARVAEKAAVGQLAAMGQERDALRRALAAPASISNLKTVSGQLELSQQVTRGNELQALVTELQRQAAELQHEAEGAMAAEAAQRAVAAAAEARASGAEARCVQLEKEADSLALDVASLQSKLGQGEVNRASVRVLHFKMNPEWQYQRDKVDSAAAELRTENAALRQRLDELAREVEAARSRLGGSGSAGGDPTPQADNSAHGVAALAVRDAEVAVLRHRASELEKSMARLKEVTKERVVAFREACYCLFGYRVDMTSEATSVKDAANAPTTFSLKPQHADDASFMLVFRYTKARGMELVPNEYSARMAREVDTFVRKFNSIPAFTANLTIENFQKQTQC